MFRELLSKVTAQDVEYAFSKKSYIYPARPYGLKDFLDWFTDSDLFSYLNDYCDIPDFFSGFMTGISLFAAVAIEQKSENKFKEFIDCITLTFAHQQVFGEHTEDCVMAYLCSLDDEGATAIREWILKESMPFADSLYCFMQILYSFECCVDNLVGDDSDKVDANEGEILEDELDDWPELFG